jgi:hypothetical protein
MKRLTVIVLMGLLYAGQAWAVEPSMDCKKAEEVLSTLFENGHIMKMTAPAEKWPKEQDFHVNPAWWHGLTDQDKRGMAWALSFCNKCSEGDSCIIIVIDGYSGKKLAYFGQGEYTSYEWRNELNYMKKLTMFGFAACLIAILAFAGGVYVADKEVTLKRTIIDNHWAKANKADLAKFITNHSKGCVLMPDSAASGFAIYTDGKLHKFNKASNAKIEEFVKKADSTLQVEVVAMKTKGGLRLVLIKNEK